MFMNLKLKTRTPLITDERLLQLEERLRQLAGHFLGQTLVLTIDEKVPMNERQHVNLSSPGWLVRCIREEIARSDVGVKQWAAHFGRQSVHAPKYTRRFKNAHIYFVTPDGSKEVFVDADERKL